MPPPRGRGAAGLLCPAVLQAILGLSGAPGVPALPPPRCVSPGAEAGHLPGAPLEQASSLPPPTAWLLALGNG